MRTAPNAIPCRDNRTSHGFRVSAILKSALALWVTSLLLPAWSQLAVTINPASPNKPPTLNYWAGIKTTNVLGVGSNSVIFANPNATVINLAVSGQPAGLTTVLSTNTCTNTLSLGLNLLVTNVSAGVYPLTLNASGAASYTTNVNLFVVPQWVITNNTANWSSGSSWSGGAVPTVTDSVYIENQGGGFTNVVDTSRAIQDLIMLGDKDANLAAGTVCAMQIPTGVTLSVLGTNGFFVGAKANNNTRPWYDIAGAGTLVVSNFAANFAVANGASSSSTRALQLNLTNLNTFNATVNRFGVGDSTLNYQGLLGGNLVGFGLAKTNVITALYADNYAGLNFQNSIQYQANGDLGRGSANPVFNLGISNGIYADSLGVGRTGAQGTSAVGLSGGGSTLKFLSLWSNSVTPTASAYFRNTNGGRMSLLAVAVDSGSAAGIKNTKGSLDLRGGVTDMLVDQIWIGRNRTNEGAQIIQGALLFDWGKVNANTVEVGYMQYTNAATVNGFLVVGTNGTLSVNNNLELAHTPSDNLGFPAALASSSGQIQINNGGTIHTKKITVGQFSTNSAITVLKGGVLDVTNNVADASRMLSSLTSSGGGLTLHIAGPNTIIYASNLTASAASPINIASVSGISSYPVTISVISYASATTPNNWVGGTGPAGLSVGVANNSANNTIDLTLSTGTPKTLMWQGYVDNTWNSTTPNWLDVTTGLHTNFSTLDKVIFDDSAAAANITITEDVVPSQTPAGILMTNNLAAYNFTGSGRILGGATVTKGGTNSFMVDTYTEFGINVNQGGLIITSSGTIGSASMVAGTKFVNGGTVLGAVYSAGQADNMGTITGLLTVQSGGLVTNWATVNGALTVQSGALLYNAGTFNGIGSATVATNATLINAGTLYGSSLTVNGTLTDIIANSTGSGPGSINVGTLTVNGTFNPGGNAVATTKITDYAADGSTQLGNPNGRVQLSAGSLTVLQVNSAASQPYTKLLSQNQGFGPSQVSKAINGCTLMITNVGPTPFSAGQSFKFFGQYYNDGNINSAGANTTNAFPLIVPKIPGPGLVWDLSQLIPGGTIGIISADSVQINLTNKMTIANGTNLVAELSWPSDYIGSGWLQQQITTLTNGLGTNWSNVGASTTVNDITLTNVINGNSAIYYRFVRP